MSESGQLELGYLPVNFFNFPHFQGFATITRTNIIGSVSNFGNRKVHRKYRSSSNMSKIGQPELGYLPLNFFNFPSFSRFCNDNSNKYCQICFKLLFYYYRCDGPVVRRSASKAGNRGVKPKMFKLVLDAFSLGELGLVCLVSG